MSGKMVAVGIDLAVQPTNTGVCVLREDTHGLFADFDRKRRDDGGLAELLVEAKKEGVPVAIDVPLGWPEKFVSFLRDPRSLKLDDLDQTGKSGNYRFIELRLRAADRELRDYLPLTEDQHPPDWDRPVPSPLSVSTDKLGAATIRWYAIRARLDGMGAASAADRVLETYPAAARYIWNWPARQSLPDEVASLDRSRTNQSSPSHHKPVRPNEHELDALVASLVARLNGGGLQQFPRGDEPDDEGTIWIPKVGTGPLRARA
jgi:predicted nuclease with RNAse H fold